MDETDSLAQLHSEIGACRRCERLVAWREAVAAEKRASYRDWTYWGRGVPGFGDPAARVLVLGLAPAAHGANRTGRLFTGDRSGDWLFRAMQRAGFANQPNSDHVDDGLILTGAWISAAVRCAPPANKPTPQERDACRPFLDREVELLRDLRVVVALGQFAYDVAARQFAMQGRPRFGHGVEAETTTGNGRALIIVCSFHPSQQNTFTGRLTEAMLDAVFTRAALLTTTASPQLPLACARSGAPGPARPSRLSSYRPE